MAQRKKTVIERELETLEMLKNELRAQLTLLKEARIDDLQLVKKKMTKQERMSDTWRKARAFERYQRAKPHEAESYLNGA